MSSLVFTSGTLTIDVDSGELTHSDGSFLLGEFTDKTFTATDGTTYSYQITTFTADTINIGSGVVVNVVGKNPLSLRTRNHGNLTINATINVSGGDAAQDPHLVGVGVAGGYDGSLANVNGQGPGGGKAKGVNNNGGGGAYGGRGLISMP